MNILIPNYQQCDKGHRQTTADDKRTKPPHV